MKKRTMIVAGSLVAGSLWLAAVTQAPALPVTQPPVAKRDLTPLEREAVAYFGDSQPRVKGPGGVVLAPSNAAHVLAIKVNAYKNRIARQAEQRDPSFKEKAEAELERARPQHASIEWEEEAGNRRLDFLVEDSRACGLDERTALQLTTDDITHHPCFDRGPNLWADGSKLSVTLQPVTKQEATWRELLRDTMRAMAVQSRLGT